MSSSDGDQLVVPKFGSFKSKETQEKPKDREERGKRDSRDDKRKRSHHDDRHERRRRDSRESKRRKERPRSHERESRPERKVANVAPAPQQTSQPELFLLDTKGDPLIRRYGTLERSQVPAYYRYGRGRVLGTTGKLIIYRDGPNDYFGLRMPGEGPPGYRDRDGLRSKRPMAHSHPISLRRRLAVNPEDERDEGFLSLNSAKQKKRKEEESSDDDEGPSYRSIEGKAKAAHFESDFDSDSDSSAEVDNIETSNPLKWKSIQLNRRVKETPEDIDSWLELVEHQDELLRASTAEGTAPENEAHSYSEIKVSMLEKALQNTNDSADRERVLVPLMREGAKVWSSKVAAKKWAELGGQADSHALWRVRVAFTMASITEFEHGKVRTMLLERLRLILSRSVQDTRAGLEVIEVFLLATRFIYDGGYRELAVAAWQALLELSFFRPDVDAWSTSVPESFQDFWESEVARIGDAGATGWAQHVLAGGDGEPPEPFQAPVIEAAQSRDAFKAWSQVEAGHASNAKLPARTMDEGTEDDPFRVVTYADIEPLLFMLPQALISSLTSPLLDAFLIFCGLPPASSSEWARNLYKDQLLAPLVGNIPSTDIDDKTPELNEDESIVRRPPLFDRRYSAFTISSELLFSGKDWFRYMGSQLQSAAVESAWLERLLGQLVSTAGMKDLSEYYLAISFAREPASVKKVAKRLLKQSPDNAVLYNAYALAEYARGNTDVALKVIESAIASPLLSEQTSRFLLQRTAAWIVFVKGNITASKRALCAVGGRITPATSPGDEVPSADVLKASSALSSSMAESLSIGNIESAEAAANCLVFLSYLTSSEALEPMSLSQGNISAAMRTLDSACQELTLRHHGKSASHERLVQSAAHLLYIHATKGPHRRAYIRDQIRKHLQVFPANTILLSILEWSDAGMRIVDETRQLLRDQALLPGADCAGSRLFAVQHELARGNAHTARAAFEQAVRSDACHASAALWVWYVRFAHAHRRQLRGSTSGEGSNKVAVDVFYQALRHCPGQKAVLLEAFLTLAGEMSSDELRSVYGMMSSKGLRVHVELDEFMESRQQG